MERQSPLFVWLLIIVIPAPMGKEGKKRNGLELAFGASKRKAVINSYPKGDEFMLKEGCTLAIGKDKMDRCATALRCRQTE